MPAHVFVPQERKEQSCTFVDFEQREKCSSQNFSGLRPEVAAGRVRVTGKQTTAGRGVQKHSDTAVRSFEPDFCSGKLAVRARDTEGRTIGPPC